MQNSVRSRLPLTVGIMGAGSGCGVTHFAVLLANYLTAVELKKAAVFEWNPRNDLEKLVDIYTGGRRKNSPVSLFDVDYFFGKNPEDFQTCMQNGYEMVLLDLGRADEGRQTEFLQCQKQCFIFALNEWKLQEAMAQKELWKKGKGCWDFFMVFGSREARREIGRRYGLTIAQVPFAPDAFVIGRETAEFFNHFWKQGRNFEAQVKKEVNMSR